MSSWSSAMFEKCFFLSVNNVLELSVKWITPKTCLLKDMAVIIVSREKSTMCVCLRTERVLLLLQLIKQLAVWHFYLRAYGLFRIYKQTRLYAYAGVVNNPDWHPNARLELDTWRAAQIRMHQTSTARELLLIAFRIAGHLILGHRADIISKPS